ncbi:hypothetical protein [Massilia rubra]|uniref:hypothetical protein n=1 Tax=Massilia rubra TaxID=2607910 RepID=UPI0014231552|nr:hypothetical protein [Massilia rubra]
MSATGAAITVDATRKWLPGAAVPTQGKLRSSAAGASIDPALSADPHLLDQQ